MSRWFYLAAIGILTHALAYAQQPGNSSPTPPRFDTGTIANRSYSNECFGFTFPIPDGWDMSPGVSEGKAIHSPDGRLTLLILDRHTEYHVDNHIVLTAFEVKDPAMSAQDFVSRAVQTQINSNPGRGQLIRETFAVDYAGKRFFRADYKLARSDVDALYMAFGYMKFRGYFIGTNLVAGTPEELEKSADSLRGIFFQEDQPNAKCVSGVINSGPPQMQPGERVHVSQSVIQSFRIKSVPPQYPYDARQAHIQGSVVLKAMIDINGNVEDLTLISGHPMLVSAAIEAVKRWKYRPYLLNGQPVKVETQITVNFRLGN